MRRPKAKTEGGAKRTSAKFDRCLKRRALLASAEERVASNTTASKRVYCTYDQSGPTQAHVDDFGRSRRVAFVEQRAKMRNEGAAVRFPCLGIPTCSHKNSISTSTCREGAGLTTFQHFQQVTTRHTLFTTLDQRPSFPTHSNSFSSQLVTDCFPSLTVFSEIGVRCEKGWSEVFEWRGWGTGGAEEERVGGEAGG